MNLLVVMFETLSLVRNFLRLGLRLKFQLIRSENFLVTPWTSSNTIFLYLVSVCIGGGKIGWFQIITGVIFHFKFCTPVSSPLVEDSWSECHGSEWLEFFPNKFPICQDLTKSTLQLKRRVCPKVNCLKGLSEGEIQMFHTDPPELLTNEGLLLSTFRVPSKERSDVWDKSPVFWRMKTLLRCHSGFFWVCLPSELSSPSTSSSPSSSVPVRFKWKDRWYSRMKNSKIKKCISQNVWRHDDVMPGV